MRVGMYSISPAHYNDIPATLLQGEKSILEFGCATGINHLISRHRDFFIENNKAGNYLGVDIESYEERYLNIEQGDIRNFETDQRFDIILVLHVLEHIELIHWRSVLRKMKSWLNPDGHLVIGTPHNEPTNTDKNHLVSRITPEMILHYLPDARVRQIKTKYAFAEDDASFWWALLRYIKRWLTRHPFVRPYARLLAIWKKKVIECKQ